MTTRRRRKTVLVIDDDADILRFVSRVLELEGYAVLQANNGDEGLRLAREKKCHLVLLDLRMPGRDGWSVLEEIVADSKLCTVPVIVLTASAHKVEEERAYSMGAQGYSVKPLSAASLRERVSQALAKE